MQIAFMLKVRFVLLRYRNDVDSSFSTLFVLYLRITSTQLLDLFLNRLRIYQCGLRFLLGVVPIKVSFMLKMVSCFYVIVTIPPPLFDSIGIVSKYCSKSIISFISVYAQILSLWSMILVRFVCRCD